MAIETHVAVKPGMIRKLQGLVRANVDSHDLLSKGADNLLDERVSVALRELAVERTAQAEELRHWVAANSDQPAAPGTIRAAAHRAWTNLRSALNSSNTVQILDDIQKSEENIRRLYEAALLDSAGLTVSDILARHYQRAKNADERMRTVRDIRKSVEE